MTFISTKPYDPARPLISLHVPKCAGTGLMNILSTLPAARFRFLPHYPDINENLPPDWKEPGVVIHGHFQRFKGEAIETVCPGADQFMTVLRDPLDILVSSYYYGVREKLPWAVDNSIERYFDWWFAQPEGPLATALPASPPTTSIDEYISGFACIGLMESLPAFYEVLGHFLDITIAPPRIVNKTKYKFESTVLRSRAEQNFAWDYALIERVRACAE